MLIVQVLYFPQENKFSAVKYLMPINNSRIGSDVVFFSKCYFSYWFS